MRILATLTLLLLCPVFAGAQDAAPVQKDDVALEVFQMTRSMDELILLLRESIDLSERDATLQKLEIAVSYLNFRSRRIESKEQELKERRALWERTQAQIARIEDDPERWERTNKWAKSNPASPAFGESPATLRLSALRKRLQGLDEEVEELEAEILRLNGELVELEAFVQENLTLVR